MTKYNWTAEIPQLSNPKYEEVIDMRIYKHPFKLDDTSKLQTIRCEYGQASLKRGRLL
ncbi:hypothetical protein WUBG_14021, partial [Wuchereria bancrofti]